MKALISPNEGYRICEVKEQTHEMADPFFWIDCPNDCSSKTYRYNQETASIEPIPQSEFTEQKWKRVKNNRNTLLKYTDFMVLPDAPFTSTQKTEIQNYRQALRDIPQNNSDPYNISWPPKPDFL